MYHLFSLMLIFVFARFIFCFQSASQCTQLYNYLTHTCESCPANTVITSDQTYCNCTLPFHQNLQIIGFNHNQSCTQLSGAFLNSQIISLHDRDGSYNPQFIECTDSYPNINKTTCIPCGDSMTYDSTLNRCICTNSNYYLIGQSCIQATSTPTTSFSSGSLDAELYQKSFVGCAQQNDQTSCQILLNYCSRNIYNSTQFCTLLTSGDVSQVPTYQLNESILTQSLDIFASSQPGTNTTTVKNTLEFILFQYNYYGELLDIKPLSSQILPCISTEEDVIYFQSFGLNLLKTCNIEDMNTPYQYYYDLFVKNLDGIFYPVPIRFPLQNARLFTRFSLLDISFKANMTFNSDPPLTVPYLNYTTQDTPTIVTESRSSSVNITLTAPFIIFNIGILVIFIINFYKYIKYNPDETNDPYYVFKLILMFFLTAIKHWGLGLWIFLFGLSAYAFCFFKFQQTVYLMLPHFESQYWQYYDPFLALFYAQFSFVLIATFLLTYDIANSTDYFLIDWQKQKDLSNFDIRMGQQRKQASVWRKVLLVNQLYELTVKNIIDIEFVVLFGLLFLKGLNWINLSYQIPNIQDLDSDYTSSIINPVLSYFIITFVMFIIAIIMYIIRHAIKIWQPLPYQNFVDLCSISNISLVIFDEALHGYYLHGVNPLGQAQGSLQYIDSIFQKQARAFGKSRAFQNDDPDKIQIFQVMFPFEIRQAFQMKYKNRYLQKLMGRAYNTSVFSKPIPEMMEDNDYKQLQSIQNDMLQTFKHYLQGVKTSQFNIKQRGFLGKLFSCPENMQLIGRLPIFYKDLWHEFTNVLMSGHQFLQLVNVINFINIFFIATQNIFMGVFIGIMITRLIRLMNDFMIKRNISRNTLIDDKFFN